MKLMNLIKTDLKNYFRSPFYFIAMVLLAILTLIAAVFISSSLFVSQNFLDPITLIIVDKEQSFYTGFFIQNILDTPSLQENMYILQTTETEAKGLLAENKAAGMVVIPEDFTSKMQESIFQPILVVGNPKKPLQASLIKEGMESATNLISAAQSAVFTVTHYASKEALSPSAFDQVFQKAALRFSLKVLGRGQIFSQKIKTPWIDLEPLSFYFSSVLVLLLSLSALQGMTLYVRERENKIITRIKISGISLWEILISKWVSLTFFLFVQASMILLICYGLDLFPDSIHIPLGLGGILIICSCISSITLLVSSFCKTTYIGSMIIFFISIVGVFLGGGIVPYSYMPNFIEKLGRLSLSHWAIQALVYSLFTSNNQILRQSRIVMGVLTIFCLGLVYLRLRWEDHRI